MPPNENRKVWLSRADEERRHRRNAVGALAVLDHDRLAPFRRQPFRHHARGQIHAAAGRQRHDEADGALRPTLGLRLRLCLYGRHPGDRGEQGDCGSCRDNTVTHDHSYDP